MRVRSVDNVIEEIQQVLKQYPFINTLIFEDDILFLNRKWAEEFAEKYRQVVRLPFICHVRADITNEGVVNLLKKAGCVHVKFGLESGNEEIRLKILNRPMTNEQIKKAFSICKKAGLIIEAYNMVGIPDESPRSILNTIKMNATIGVDRMHVSICQPIVGSKLAELCEEKHLLEPRNMSDNSVYPDFYSVSSLNLDTISRSQVLMFRNYFKVLVRYYRFLQGLPAGTSEILIRPSDRILSSNLISKVLNQIYLPLNCFYQRWLILMLRRRVKRRKPIHPKPGS